MSIKYSIVIPVYNEELNIIPLYNILTEVMKKLEPRGNYEIIFVDDGSSDGSFNKLKSLSRKDSHVKVVQLRRNFGQSAALNAGFDYADGEIIIVLDGDLQNDPRDIPKLLAKMDEGYDVVSGWRYPRKDPFLTKRLPSLISNWLARKLTGVNIHDFGCSLKSYRRETIKNLKLYGEMHRYIPAIVMMEGFKVGEVKVRHHPRKYGKTKYSGSRLIRGLLDLMYIKFRSKYGSRPLHFYGQIGILLVLLGVIIAFYKVVIELLILNMPLEVGPLLLLSALLLITGIQIFMFGFLSEMQLRTYYERADVKPYRVREILGDIRIP